MRLLGQAMGYFLLELLYKNTNLPDQSRETFNTTDFQLFLFMRDFWKNNFNCRWCFRRKRAALNMWSLIVSMKESKTSCKQISNVQFR